MREGIGDFRCYGNGDRDGRENSNGRIMVLIMVVLNVAWRWWW